MEKINRVFFCPEPRLILTPPSHRDTGLLGTLTSAEKQDLVAFMQAL